MTSKTFPAKTEAWPAVFDFASQLLETHVRSGKLRLEACVALEEVFVNVAHYAYGEGDGEVTLDIGFFEEDRSILFRMWDTGIPFDPLQKPDPDITLSIAQRQIGGLGIFLVKQIMDSVTYTYENGKNILTMIKKIQGDEPL